MAAALPESDRAVYQVEALDREATGDGWDFEFDGEVYTLPSDFDMRAAIALTTGALEEGLRILLGQEQWERIDASSKVFGMRELRRMLAAYCTEIGVDLGEFGASSGSSRRTVAPSKRTSNGSTGSRSRTSSRSRKR
jgi:hypothetical protein